VETKFRLIDEAGTAHGVAGATATPRPAVPLLHSLEGLRLIASLGIVAIHFAPHVGAVAPRSLNLFVDLFFVISGIVIGSLYIGQIRGLSDYGVFIKRRLARIYPLHVATLVFYILVGVGTASLHLPVSDRSRFAWDQVLPNLSLTHAWFPGGQLSFNFVSWSISAEFLAYLAFPLIGFLVARRFFTGLLLIAASLAVGIAIAELAQHMRLYELKWEGALPRILPSFALGVWLAAFGPRLAARFPAPLAKAACLACSIALAGAMALDVSGYVLLLLVYAVVTTAYLCDLHGVPTFASWRPISERGYLTYSIYMLHVPVTTVFLSLLFPRLLGTSVYAQWLGLLLAVPIVFVLAELSFRFFEQPLRRWMR
jgi:peptidoglycan/LPS O-acetylase OafA/YrhL